MNKCKYCGKEIDNRFNYCNINHRRKKQLSLEGERNFPIKSLNPDYNKENYKATSKRLIGLHKEFGHLVNVC